MQRQVSLVRCAFETKTQRTENEFAIDDGESQGRHSSSVCAGRNLRHWPLYLIREVDIGPRYSEKTRYRIYEKNSKVSA